MKVFNIRQRIKEYFFPIIFIQNKIRTVSDKNYWWYVLITKPHLYLYTLIKHTLLTGIITGFIFYLFQRFGSHQQTVPTAFHTLISFVLAMMLVFRTNTAYDRWWKARELFSKLESLIYYYISIIKIKVIKGDINEKQVKLYKHIFIYSLTLIYKFLAERNDPDIKRKFLDEMYNLQQLNYHTKITELDYTNKEILETFTSFERILDTPIPTSYSLHIKLSIFTYLLTLPFGLFYDLGYWSIPLVMILYIIIAGVEIISNEIENPFKGDPNDLPVKDYLDKIKVEIISQLK